LPALPLRWTNRRPNATEQSGRPARPPAPAYDPERYAVTPESS